MGGIAVDKLRNVAILGHNGAGKTTLVESMLFNSGETTRRGSVTDGNTVTDFEPEEIERQMSLSSAIAFTSWKGFGINIIDTPGVLNFLEDARGCLRAADGTVILVSALSGVKATSQKINGFTDEFNLPRLVLINEMDRENADFDKAVDSIEDAFQSETIVLNLPIGAGEKFGGIVDILHMKAYKFTDGKSQPIDIPDDMKNNVELLRKQLVERVAELDDSLLEKYLETETLEQEEVVRGFKRGAISRCFIPILCGSALKNMGVTELLDAITECLPSPLERSETYPIVVKDMKTEKEVTLNPSEDEPFSAYIFKTIADSYAGKLNLFRVFSGRIKADTMVYNSSKDSKERIGNLAHLLGKIQKTVTELGPGEIGVIAKLKDSVTGDTLCSETRHLIFEPMKFAEPMLSYALEPKSKGDEDKVSIGLHRLLDEDPTLHFHRDEESNEMILSGMGQIHVEIALQKLKRKFGVEVVMKAPTIPYRETIRKKATAQGRYKKQSGGRGQFGDCYIDVEPLPRGGGFEFVNSIFGGAIPRQYIPAVEKGIVDKLKNGILAGYQMVDVKVNLTDGSYHTVDSSEMAFKMAGSFAIRKAAMDADPVLLEPLIKAEIFIPDEFLGAVIGDLNSKRGKVSAVDPQSGGGQKILAVVPMSEMLTYANQLHSLTSGQGLYTMEPSHYEEMPSHLAQKIIAARKREEEE